MSTALLRDIAEALRLQRAGGNYYSVGLDNSRVNFVYNSQTTANSTLTIDGGSNRVGIGTHAPDRPLHVNGGGINVLASFESTDAGAYLSFSDDSTTNDTSVRLGASGNNLQIFTNGSERIRVNSSGSVGIGTTNPVAKLEVNGSIRTSTGAGATLTVFDDTVGRNNRFVAGADADGAYINSTYSSGGTGRIRFQTVQNERIRISQAGNVSIGVESDSSYRLDVQTATGGAIARFKDTDSSYDGIRIEGGTGGGIISNASGLTKEALYFQNDLNALRITPMVVRGCVLIPLDELDSMKLGCHLMMGMQMI